MSASSGRENPGASTRRLISHVLRGSRTAAGDLLNRYDALLHGQIRHHLGPQRFARDGEDALQTVRLAILRALPGVQTRNGRAFEAWLRKTIRSRLFDWERARRASCRRHDGESVSLSETNAPQIVSEGPTPSRVLSEQEEVEQLEEAIGSVPARYQELLWFLYREDPKPSEVATFLGKHPEAARKFVARALTHLRRVLSPPEPPRS